MRKATLLLILCAAAASGCGGSDAPSDEVIAELDAFARGPSRVIALASAMVAPGTLFLAAPDENLLDSISARLGTETSDCAKRTRTPGTLSVNFAPTVASACTLQTAKLGITGTMTVTIAREGATVHIPITLDLIVDGEPFTEQMVINTDDANSFTFRALASLAGHGFKIASFSGTPIDGATLTSVDGETRNVTPTRPLTWTSVGQRLESCHPHTGTIAMTAPAEGIDRAITFTDDSPLADRALYREGESSVEISLPHLPSCPPRPED